MIERKVLRTEEVTSGRIDVWQGRHSTSSAFGSAVITQQGHQRRK